MGGKRVHPLGLGDDDINIEDDFVQWKEAFWNSVCEEFQLENLGDDFSMRQYEATVLKEGKTKTTNDRQLKTKSKSSRNNSVKVNFSLITNFTPN